MSGWSTEEWEEFCGRRGIDARKALRTGKVDLNEKKRDAPPRVSDPKREQDPKLALDPPVSRTQPVVEDSGRSPRVHIIIRGLRVRFLDPDNFIAGCKGLVDGIVKSGITPDDSQKAVQAGELRIDYEQQLVTSYTRESTEIEIIWATDP